MGCGGMVAGGAVPPGLGSVFPRVPRTEVLRSYLSLLCGLVALHFIICAALKGCCSTLAHLSAGEFPKWEFWEIYLLWGIAFGRMSVTLFKWW